MMIKRAIPLALLCAAIPLGRNVNATNADVFRFDTTADLYRVCALTEDTPEFAVANQACRAFIEATVQYHDEISARRKLKRLICYPPGTTIEDGKQAFLEWAERRSDDAKLMAEQPVVGLVRALAAKYPCERRY